VSPVRSRLQPRRSFFAPFFHAALFPNYGRVPRMSPPRRDSSRTDGAKRKKDAQETLPLFQPEIEEPAATEAALPEPASIESASEEIAPVSVTEPDVPAALEPDPELVLWCDGIQRYLGEAESRVHVLDNVALHLYAERVYSIMGPSGCGKSTLLYLLGLLDRPDAGTLNISGQEVSALDDNELALFRNREIGFVFQFHFLLKEFTALENVQIPMRRAGLLNRHEMEDRAFYLLELVGLGDKVDRRADHLSGGEQQRVAIARALANDPRLLLADEPTGNLDTANSRRIFTVLQNLARETGLALLIVTHNTQIAEASDHIFTMRDGRIVE
jgi:lipoprotein-releasing system ATP-binding protein